MARGGQRAGTPGRAYPNRTDMHQPVKVADGGQYGSRKMLENAQRVVPLPEQPPVPPVGGSTGGGPAARTAMLPQSGLTPGSLDFERSTEQPDQPVTDGLPVGPGAGPEALGLGVGPNDPATLLRSIYMNVPQAQNNDVLRLIEAFDKRVQ